MEAFSTLEDEKKRHRKRFESLEQQLREVERNVISPHAPSLANHLDRAQVEARLVFQEFKDRLLQALEFLGSTAELIHPTPEVIRVGRSNVLIEDLTDNLILASILDHAKGYPSEGKIFLSENRKDFDTNVKVRLALREAGIRYFADAAKCLEWHRSQDES